MGKRWASRIHTCMPRPAADIQSESGGEVLRPRIWCNPTCRDKYKEEMAVVPTAWPLVGAMARYPTTTLAKVTSDQQCDHELSPAVWGLQVAKTLLWVGGSPGSGCRPILPPIPPSSGKF